MDRTVEPLRERQDNSSLEYRQYEKREYPDPCHDKHHEPYGTGTLNVPRSYNDQRDENNCQTSNTEVVSYTFAQTNLSRSLSARKETADQTFRVVLDSGRNLSAFHWSQVMTPQGSEASSSAHSARMLHHNDQSDFEHQDQTGCNSPDGVG